MTLFSSESISARRLKVQASLELLLQNDDVLLLFCGEPVQKPGGLDQTYEFLPHPDYYWLTGSRRASGILTFSKAQGWKDFTKYITREEKLWEGSSEISVLFQGQDLSNFENWIRAEKFGRILCLGQPSLEQKKLEKNASPEFRFECQEALNRARRKKDSSEIQVIRDIAQLAAKGYTRLESFIQPGVSERQIQIEFETEVLKAGAEKFPYDSIVGSGPNAAVLHAIPTSKIVQKGELVLIDAGADIQDYCVDITRVFAADQKFTSQQKDIYNLVLKAQSESIAKCQPGVSWVDVHLCAARVIAEGLKSLNLMKGDTDSLLETGAISVFFPHGVGHMVGLKVRDVGGVFNASSRISCGVRLRVDLALEENFVMTVEPGLYFVQALLEDVEVQKKYQDQINWREVQNWKNFGGVRLEDDILVTGNGPENLTGHIRK